MQYVYICIIHTVLLHVITETLIPIKRNSKKRKGGNQSYNSSFQRRHQIITWTFTIGSILLSQELKIQESCDISKCKKYKLSGLWQCWPIFLQTPWEPQRKCLTLWWREAWHSTLRTAVFSCLPASVKMFKIKALTSWIELCDRIEMQAAQPHKNKEEKSHRRQDIWSYTQKDGFNSQLGFHMLSAVKGD